MATRLRERKDGGLSECSSPDEMVGKGRCNHILGNGNSKQLEVTRMQRGMYNVEIDESKDNEKEEEKKINDFMSSLPKLDKEKEEKILKSLNKM